MAEMTGHDAEISGHDQPKYALCEALEPIVRHLTPGGSICLNISNDIFLKKSPARSLYQERLAIAMHDRLGMFKMDMIPWVNPSRPPGPMQWASRTRQQLNYTWDPIWWFSNDPVRCLANNRRVLEPHTPEHAALQARGGEDRTTNYGDGSYRLREGSYGKPTAGRIPRNLITRSHKCAQTNLLRAAATAQGLPLHGATMPVDVCRQMIDFLTEEDDLVVDPFSGWFKTAKAAQQAGRRWIGTELMGEYALGAAAGFTDEDGFQSFGSRA
jgi:site-specific DNA-methyltransferase (cytosine-N4-specific)